jgi:predicted ATPase/DNA-binding XRE family transcriptional regulator
MATAQSLSFGMLLRRLRREAQLTQAQLASRAGLSVDAIAALEHGRRRWPHADTLTLLVEALELAPEQHRQLQRAAHRPPLAADQGVLPLPVGTFLGAAPEGPLVARVAEVTRLTAALEAVQGGAGRCLVLAGEPGIGKTRLAQEVAREALLEGLLVGTGRCYEPQQAMAYAPVTEALGLLYAAAPQELREALPQRWPEVLPLLPQLEASPVPVTPATPSEPDDQHRLWWQVTGFVQALADVRPLALLLDDLQWADEATLTLWCHVARHTRRSRILLLGTYRDGELHRQRPLRTTLHELQRERLLERVTLRAFAAEEIEALIAGELTMAGLPGGEVGGELTTEIQRITAGNPLFVQEVLRLLVQRGDLVQCEGRWQRRTAGELDVPETVREAVVVRMEQLSPVAQTVLQQASVLGQVFAPFPLQQMVEHAPVEVEEALDQALLTGLLHETPEGEYHFSHVLVQRAIYEKILAPRRRRLHRAAGVALERLHERERTRRAAELVWHFTEGDEPARALPYALLAGAQAAGVHAYAAAERTYRLALTLAREVDDLGQEAEALEHLGVALVRLANFEDALRRLEEGLAAYRTLDDVEGTGRVLGYIGEACLLAGWHAEGLARLQAEEEHLVHAGLSAAGVAELHLCLSFLFEAGREWAGALASAERAVQHANQADDARLIARATLRRGFTLRLLGQLDAALPLEEEAVERLAAEGDDRRLWSATFNLAVYFQDAGEFARAAVYRQASTAAAERDGAPTRIIRSVIGTGDLAYASGEWTRAQVQFDQAAALVAPGRTSWGQIEAAYLAMTQGTLWLAQGQQERGTAALHQALAWGEHTQDLQLLRYAQAALAEHDLVAGQAAMARDRLAPLLLDHHDQEEFDVTLGLPLLAWAHLEMGAVTDARRMVEQAVARAERINLRLALLNAWRVQALVALRQHRWHVATATLEQGLAVCRALPVPYAEAKALAVLGQLHQARGAPEPAHACYTDALAILDQLGERLYAESIARARELLAATNS